jgi:hypothetical protein
MAAKGTAGRLRLALGEWAAEAVELCLEDCRRTDDRVAIRYWSDEAAQLLGMIDDDNGSPVESPCAERQLSRPGRAWLLMQRFERYRHRAMQAARKVAGSKAFQAKVLAGALREPELAQQAKLLTQEHLRARILSRRTPPSRGPALGRR